MLHHSRRQFVQSMLAATALLLPRLALAQQRQVLTIAGTGIAGYEAEGSSGLIAIRTPINNPYGVVIGPDSALYFCEVDSGRMRRLELASNRLTTIAGTGEKGFSAQGQRALQTPFSAPHEIRFDEQGNLYVVERDAHAVRRIAAGTGLVTLVAGTGRAGFSGDGGPSVLAELRQPHSIAFDSQGNLLICDIGNGRIRSVSRATGVISTLAGTGENSPTPDNGAMSSSALLGPRSLDTDRDGNAYLVLREGNAIYRLDLAADRLQRIAGTGAKGYSGDGGAAIDATFNGPKGIAYSSEDNSLYIVDTENHVIRRLALSTGMIDTVLGTGERADGADGDPLRCQLNRPHGVFVARRGYVINVRGFPKGLDGPKQPLGTLCITPCGLW